MSSISTLSPASTYPDLLQIANSGQGLNDTPSQIQDGVGNPTSMTISSNYINFNRSMGEFQIDGVALTANINTLNTIAAVADAQYVLLSPNPQLTNGLMLTTTDGLSISQSSDNVIISPSSELAGIQQLFSGPSGMVVNLGGGNYDTRNLISDATINIVNGSGVLGDPTFNVIPDTSVQRINSYLVGIFQSRKSQLNFIPGPNMGINVVDNPSLNRTDLTFSSLPGSAFVFKGEMYAASAANLDADYDNGAAGVGATLTNNGVNAAFELDGVNPPLNSFVLINTQDTLAQNGIYEVTTVGDGATPWVLTRPSFYNSPSSIVPATFVFVTNGDTYAGTAWIETLTVNTVGTDPIQFIEFAITGTVTDVSGTPGEIVVLNGTTTPVISIDPGYIGQTSITTLGTVTTGTWEADPIEVPYGGTGVSSTDAFGVLCGGTTDTAPFQNVGTGAEGQILISNGPDELPSWGDTSLQPFQHTVNQVNHGLAEEDIIRCTTSNVFIKAQADLGANATAIVGIVVEVLDDDNFVFQFGGIVTGLTVTGGEVYFLDPDTAGAFTNVPPSIQNQVRKPLLIAITDTSALWINQLGQVLGQPTG
jgi:hypothetical protein